MGLLSSGCPGWSVLGNQYWSTKSLGPSLNLRVVREREREWKQHPPDWIKSLSNTHLGTHFLLAPNNWKVLNSLTTGFITCPLAWAATRAHCELKDPSQELCWTAQREHEVHGLSLGESEAPWEMAGRLCLGWRSVSWHVEMVLWGHGTVALGRTYAGPGQARESLSACSSWCDSLSSGIFPDTIMGCSQGWIQ